MNKFTISEKSKLFDKVLKEENIKIPNRIKWYEEIEFQIDITFNEDIGDFLVFNIYEYNESIPNQIKISKSELLECLEEGNDIEKFVESYIRENR